MKFVFVHVGERTLIGKIIEIFLTKSSNQMEFSDYMQCAEVVTQIFIGMTTLWLSFVVWRSSNRHMKAEFSRSMHENWTSLNNAMLQNERIARICDETIFNINPKEKRGDPDFHLRRHIIFMHLNIIEADFKGYKAGLISKDLLDEVIDDLLMPGFENIIELLETAGFGNEFIEYCRNRHRYFLENMTRPMDSRKPDATKP